MKSINKDLETLADIFLLCPETGETLEVIEVDTFDESGEVVLYTRGESSEWKFVVKAEKLK